MAERPSAFRRTVPSCMVASEGGSPVGDEPARTPRCAPSLARADEKAKKLRHFPRGSRDDSARRRRTEEHDAYVKSVLVFLSRAIFSPRDEIDTMTPLASYLAPRLGNRPGFATQGSARHAESDSCRPRNWRKRISPETVSALGFRSDANDSSILSLENRDTGTRDACADDEVCFVKNGGDCETTRRRTASYAPTLLRSASTQKRRGDRNHTSRDSVEDERPPAAVRAPDERVLVQVRDVIRAHGRARFFFVSG